MPSVTGARKPESVIDKTWTQPGAFEVSPGVFRIPLPLPQDRLRAVNVYAIVDGARLVLVDAGWAVDESLEALRTALKGLGFDLADISEFLVTHMHRDHYTQAVAIRRVFGTPISLGEGERTGLEALVEAATTGKPRQSLAALQFRRAGAYQLGQEMLAAQLSIESDLGYELPDTWLSPRVELRLATRRLTAIATPGHTSGHVVFSDDRAGVLFAGDHVLPHITPSIGLEPTLNPLPLGDYLESLALVRARPDAMLLPAHGPVADSVHRRVDELLDHHERRLTHSAEEVAAGAGTAAEVAARLRWTRREHPFADLDLMNAGMAITETLAHLDLLVARGWLGVVHDDAGTARFHRR
jgi:glyoxylase-like metal-dependent hydrolase (beta-lactamase superfamily II)